MLPMASTDRETGASLSNDRGASGTFATRWNPIEDTSPRGRHRRINFRIFCLTHSPGATAFAFS